MAQGAVAALSSGLVYQAHIFWHEAAKLLLPNELVEKITFEHDGYWGADDVVVLYRSPGRDVRGTCVQADLYQVKFHVDQRDAYSAESLIQRPKAGSSSLLERLHCAYKVAAKDFDAFRIHLISNWRGGDQLLERCREYDGALPEEFFAQVESRVLGQVRATWMRHLELDEPSFVKFARTLRFRLGEPQLDDLRSRTYDKLRAAGLKVPDASCPSDPAASIYQTLLVGGQTTIDAAKLRDLCDRAGLVVATTQPARPRIIGLRSFLRAADNLESETDELICVAKHFDYRTPRTHESFELATREVLAFFRDSSRLKRLRESDHELRIECLLTLAFAAGYEASRNTYARLYPFQKPMPTAWKPDVSRIGPAAQWHDTSHARDERAKDLAVVLSVTQSARADAVRYLDVAGVAVRAVVELAPCPLGSATPQTGPSSIHDADHAYQLALSVKVALDRLRPTSDACVHLFAAAPASLLFFIGQLREGLGCIQLYEHDFATNSYQPSARFHAGRLVPTTTVSMPSP